MNKMKNHPFHSHLTSTIAIAFSLASALTTANAGPLFKQGRDCLNSVLESIASNKKIGPDLKKTYESAARYNEEIYKKASDLGKNEWNKSLDDAIDHFADYDSRIDAKEFKEFIRHHQGPIDKNETVGTYLHKRFQDFKEGAPETDLAAVANDLPKELRKIGKECAENPACHEKKINSYLMRKINGTCLGKNKGEAVRSMVTGLSLTSAGLFAAYSANPEAGYPWDMLASTVFWTPILSEMGCRNTIAKGEIGQKVDFGQVKRVEKIKAGMNSYAEYMVLSPLTNVTYAAFHTIQQVARGEKQWKDVNLGELGLQVASLSAWDAMYPVPRMVLITDPLYMKGLPKLRKFYYKKIPTKFAAEGGYLVSDFGARIGINFINTQMFQFWLKESDELLNTHFIPPAEPQDEKAPGKSKSPTTSASPAPSSPAPEK